MKRFSTNTRALQRIDRYVGIVLCRMVTWARRIGDALGRPDLTAPARSLLLLKMTEQGSTVLAHAVLRDAARRVGRENIYMLVFEENRFIVDVLGLLPPENVLTVRTDSPWAMATSALARLRQVRRVRIDACVDLEFFSRSSATLAWLTGARLRVGFHTYFGEGPYRGDLFTHRVLYNPHLHTSRAFASLIGALDIDPETLPTLPVVPPLDESDPPRFAPAAGEIGRVQALLCERGVAPGAPLVLLNANAGDLLPLRKWAEGNYVELARRLLRDFPALHVVFTGLPEEAAAIGALVADVASPRCVSVAGATSLRELMVLYGLAEVLVTNDSGPAHFAALTGIDVIALFGPETPALFAALGPRSHPLWAGIACSPCVNAYNNRQTACRNNVCMQAIPVATVHELTCSILRQRLVARQ